MSSQTEMAEAGLLGRLVTDQGERDVYDAASQCSRCGYCEQACPTYVVSGREPFSPRGRNQLVRLMLEGRLGAPESACEALDTCLLCGACTAACYAHVPTAELVLEGRRRLGGQAGAPWAARRLGRLLAERPRALARILRLAFLLKRLGLARLARATGALRLLGLGALEEADRHLAEVPEEFLADILRRDPGMAPDGSAGGVADSSPGPRWTYFAACGTNFLFPRVGEATVRVLKAALGRGLFLDNPCCGLMAYNYGELEAARGLARRAIENWERVCGGSRAAAGAGSPSGASLPAVADCSSCAAHLKAYPRLFLDDPQWRGRAEAFSSAVRDFVELAPPEGLRPVRPGSWPGEVVTYHDSCRARHGEGVAEQPRAWVRGAAGEAYRELPEPGWCCGGAGAFAFLQPALSDEVLRRKVGHIASIQARVVAASSTSCLAQLAHGLRKYYPECRVLHVSELAAEALTAGGRPNAN